MYKGGGMCGVVMHVCKGGGMCVNFVAGERNMDTVLPLVPFSFVLQSHFCFLSALNVIVDLPL